MADGADWTLLGATSTSSVMSNPPARQACYTVGGEPVYVTLGGRLPTGLEFCTIGVRDTDRPATCQDVDTSSGVSSTRHNLDTGLVTRNDFRELIDMEPINALHLAAILIDFALLAMWRAENET